jgi:hypothetical protein
VSAADCSLLRRDKRENCGVLAKPCPRSTRRAALTTVALVAVLALTACASGDPARPAPRAATARPAVVAACGEATQSTVAAVDATAAQHIYGNELAGREVNTDLVNVTSALDLRRAVAADDRVATIAAVDRIIFHPAWHIVRLQVFDADGKLLADVGGVYTIAPVGGVLQDGPRKIGHFLMSVQDDTGETKLETRFVGNPVAIYLRGFLVAVRYARFPAGEPPGATVTIAGKVYSVVKQTFNAFPTGTVEEVMLVPPPPASLELLSCPLVRAQEFGRIAMRLASLATSLANQYPGYASTVAIYTGTDVFVRSGRRLLGTSGGPGPTNPPTSGTVSYQGRDWLVFSFAPRPPARVYLLIPPA